MNISVISVSEIPDTSTVIPAVLKECSSSVQSKQEFNFKKIILFLVQQQRSDLVHFRYLNVGHNLAQITCIPGSDFPSDFRGVQRITQDSHRLSDLKVSALKSCVLIPDRLITNVLLSSMVLACVGLDPTQIMDLR